MTELSAIKQKPVLDISTSCIIGRVSDVYFDEFCKTAVYVCIQTDDSREMLLPYEEVRYFSDALIIDDCLKLLYPDDADTTAVKSAFLSMPVYTPSGVLRGSIEAIFINASGKVVRINIGNDDITPSGIASIGDVIIYKGAFKTKSKPKARKFDIPRPEVDYPVRILNSDSISDKAVTSGETMESKVTIPAAAEIKNAATATAEPVNLSVQTVTAAPPPAPVVSLSSDKREPVLSNGAFEILLDGSSAFSYDEDAHTPTRVICDYEFLLGRKLGADLCTYTGELIAKSGSQVTDSIVEKARRAGKLVELTLNSIKPERKM